MVVSCSALLVITSLLSPPCLSWWQESVSESTANTNGRTFECPTFSPVRATGSQTLRSIKVLLTELSLCSDRSLRREWKQPARDSDNLSSSVAKQTQFGTGADYALSDLAWSLGMSLVASSSLSTGVYLHSWPFVLSEPLLMQKLLQNIAWLAQAIKCLGRLQYASARPLTFDPHHHQMRVPSGVLTMQAYRFYSFR